MIELARRRAANRGAAAAPDAVAHVGVGGVVDPGLAQVAEVLLVLLDLLVAAGQVQRDLRHVVHAGVADVPDRDAGVGVALLDLQEAFGGAQVGGGADADVLGADLLEEQELLVGGLGGRLRAQLDRRPPLSALPPPASRLPATAPNAPSVTFAKSLRPMSVFFESSVISRLLNAP